MVTQTALVDGDRAMLTELRHALELWRCEPASDIATRPAVSSVEQQAEALSAVTRQCFPPGILSIAEEQDPEDPTNKFLVLDVHTTGDFAQIERQSEAWQTEAHRIFPGDSSWLRLCVYPR